MTRVANWVLFNHLVGKLLSRLEKIISVLFRRRRCSFSQKDKDETKVKAVKKPRTYGALRQERLRGIMRSSVLSFQK